MSTELYRLLTSDDALSEGRIDVEAVLNNIDTASLNIKAGNGNFPIHAAAILPNAGSALIIIREMIATGADVNCFNDSNRTPLHMVITTFEHHESIEVIKLLLENGANSLIEDENGVKFLDIAKPEILELLHSYKKTI
ncbi:MAG: ankyrin repeat domain-containing protein [Candidatus Omnitrophica bacterium]|nr:ankyrin repeat domain-containing protein [Candidatus Omnitrophota bacterium]